MASTFEPPSILNIRYYRALRKTPQFWHDGKLEKPLVPAQSGTHAEHPARRSMDSAARERRVTGLLGFHQLRKQMTVKSQNSPKTWADPDDAPELTDEFFENGVWRIGDKIVSRGEAQAEAVRRRGRPAGSGTKVSKTIRFDADALAAFKATGDGWQYALKEWLSFR